MSASGLRRDSDAAAPPSGLVRTDEVFAGLEPARLGALERAHGNGDLVRVLEALGIAGPFVAVTPWELEGPAGERLINAGGYAALPFGEAYPPLVAFVARYLEANRWMGLPQQALSPWRGALEANLVALLAREAPSHADSQVFFSNSGAEAVETALKLVRAARPGARYLINFARAYHGKTLGALSLTPNEEFQAPFRPLLEGVVTLPYGDAQRLEDAVRKLGPDNVAGVIVEPVQGEGGVITPPAEFLPALERLRQRYGLVVVADEIQTGLGRCGALFKALAMGLEPDVITLAKPLGGGLVPVGATLARRAIMARALGGLASKRHSNTFGGGSLAMAVALKSLEIILDEDLPHRARVLGERGLARLEALQARYPGLLRAVRGSGMLFALQLQPLLSPRTRLPQELVSQLGSALALRALHRGGIHACYTLNSSRTVRLTPALTMPESVFEAMLARLEEVARRTPQAWRLPLQTPPHVLSGLARLALKG
ncbi:aspartate aminotransferase family protein [Truepera radiovictrix]|uniref:Aminotransferase class-III n=1 Tax=Truepera radiovictrix (strain DSM 17093 / CIP 108686 / LMG 22925 / RQ-24) TaxID=649638 RepID=D7CVV1_TRURR|nr:aminotransferase class III-fold pyridoxal phosphate-dependent enzyme [Truepera radiovictrix]ADI16012.1 aminotransferase class-III [Truepera radiovictrix DSM 17093]WMT58362.1 aminotransferase class III-fold pyridoxal phosphate-dependent enzyme [Truepera radiovictrix]